MNRREFIKTTATVAGGAAALAGAGLAVKELLEMSKPEHVGLDVILKNPGKYAGKRIATEGYPEFVSSRELSIPSPRMDPASGELTMSSMDVTERTILLHPVPAAEKDTRSRRLLMVTTSPMDLGSGMRIRAEGVLTLGPGGEPEMNPNTIKKIR